MDQRSLHLPFNRGRYSSQKFGTSKHLHVFRLCITEIYPNFVAGSLEQTSLFDQLFRKGAFGFNRRGSQGTIAPLPPASTPLIKQKKLVPKPFSFTFTLNHQSFLSEIASGIFGTRQVPSQKCQIRATSYARNRF